jgi:hypothetical protein
MVMAEYQDPNFFLLHKIWLQTAFSAYIWFGYGQGVELMTNERTTVDLGSLAR